MKAWMLLGVLLAGMVLAHAELESAVPAPNSSLKTLPTQVEVGFTEAVEVGVSTFKVYPLEGSFRSAQALQDAAVALVKKVIAAKNDQSKRADQGLSTTVETASKIRIKLSANLKPGTYVVMWKVLSVDGHVTTDYYTFVFKP